MNGNPDNVMAVKNWSRFHDHSEVWVFQSNKDMSSEVVNRINELSKVFCSNWQTHGVQLDADAQVIYSRFVVFIVQGGNGPSGCSKDKLTHFVEGLGKELAIDFFDRMSVIYRGEGNKIDTVGLHDMDQLVKEAKINKETIVFNNLVHDKKSFDNNWEIQLKESWHDNFAY